MAQEGEVRVHPNGGTYVRQGGVWVLQSGMPAAPAGAPAARSNGVLGVIPGVPKQPDAFQVEDQAMQREAAERAREDQAFQREKFEREQAKAATDPKLVEAERTAAFLATRVAGGIKDINTALAEDPSARKPGLGATVAGGIFGDEARNWANGPARQRVEAAQMDILDAALTLGTGAAYTREQLEAYRRSYFPTLTDDSSTITDKQERLRRLLESAKVKAGAAAPKIDEAMAALGGQAPKAAPKRLTPDQQTEFFRILETEGPGAGNAFLAQHGLSMADPKAAEQPYSRGIEYKEPGLLDEFGRQTGNIVAGIGQGLAALPDMAATTVGQAMAIPVQAMGFDDAAASLRNPFTFNKAIEGIAPTPQDTMSQANRFGGQILGSVVGFPQKAAQNVVNRIVGNAPPAVVGNALAPGGQQVMRAADDLAASTGAPIQPIAADVAGPTVRRLTSVGAQLPLSARPIVNAGQRLNNQSQAARNTIAGRTGVASDTVDAGEAVTRGLDTFRVRTSQQARTMYQKAEQAAEGAAVQPKAVLERLGEHIRAEAQIPGGSDVLPILEKLATDLSTAGSFSISGVRGMRTVLQSRLTNAGMTPTNAQRIVNELVQAAGDDISTSLTAAGKSEAAKAYRSADKFWAERMDVVNNAIKPIIGKNGEKSGEQVVQGLQQAAKGNSARLSQVMRALPEEDAATVRATIISQLGKASNGTQDAAGNAFSLNQFLTHWNQITPRARSILFDQGTLKDLNNLAVVAAGSKQASRYANASNTGSVLGGLGTGATLATDFVTMAGTALTQIGGGALLAAPGFARWMARAPRDPRAMKGHVARLATIAESNPSLADEIAAFQQALLRGANENAPQAGRLAASPDQGPQPQE